MKYIILIMTLLFTRTVLADNKPVTNNYKCNTEGCSVTCLTQNNKWSALATGAGKVVVNHYDNGNVEFLLSHGANARNDEVIMISQDNLQCKLIGIVIE
jgi:hypothetical protein